MIRSVPLALVALIAFTATARGGVIITFSQSGSSVNATGAGSINVAALTFEGSLANPAAVNPIGAKASVGAGTFDIYGPLSGPSSFGPGGLTLATSATGDIFGVSLAFAAIGLGVPHDYVSGTTLSGNATWDNTTISALGMTPGTYTWTWGSGPTADSLEVVIPAAAVPEPSSMILTATAIGVFGFRGRRIR
jgi:hypothetical protein